MLISAMAPAANGNNGGAHPFEVDLDTLSRLAQLLNGNTVIAATFARVAGQAMLTVPSWYAPAPTSRVAIIRALLRLWQATDAAQGSSHADDVGRARAAFVLAALEGLTTRAIAAAFGCSEPAAVALIEAAAREIGARMRTCILLIEGGAGASRWIEALISSEGHRPLGPARLAEQAAQLIRAHRPGLIMAQLQLDQDPASSAPLLAPQLSKIWPAPVVLFGADTEPGASGPAPGKWPVPAFVIAEPIVSETVKAVMGVALFFHPVKVGDTVSAPDAKS